MYLNILVLLALSLTLACSKDNKSKEGFTNNNYPYPTASPFPYISGSVDLPVVSPLGGAEILDEAPLKPNEPIVPNPRKGSKVLTYKDVVLGTPIANGGVNGVVLTECRAFKGVSEEASVCQQEFAARTGVMPLNNGAGGPWVNGPHPQPPMNGPNPFGPNPHVYPQPYPQPYPHQGPGYTPPYNPNMPPQPLPYPQPPLAPAQVGRPMKLTLSFDQLGLLSIQVEEGNTIYSTKKPVPYDFDPGQTIRGRTIPEDSRRLVIRRFVAYSQDGKTLSFAQTERKFLKLYEKESSLFAAVVSGSERRVDVVFAPRAQIRIVGKNGSFVVTRVFSQFELQ